jgi:hypothetical protein
MGCMSAPHKKCAVDQCDKPVRGLVWCGGHYQRWKKHGDVRADVPFQVHKTRQCGTLSAYNGHFLRGEEPCALCRAANTEYYKAYRRTPEGLASQFRTYLKTMYRMTVEVYEALVVVQGGMCAICGTTTPSGTGRWSVDHDHTCCPGIKSCGKCTRGLLCTQCNLGLGQFKDNAEVLQAAVNYLATHKARSFTE